MNKEAIYTKLNEIFRNTRFIAIDNKIKQLVHNYDYRGLNKIGHLINKFKLNWLIWSLQYRSYVHKNIILINNKILKI